ncbi:MAG: Phosphoheptose isomerase [Chlamydiae bacterium]|nr:Phosphoheptose isomerase [Chlamydiota bacterium]
MKLKEKILQAVEEGQEAVKQLSQPHGIDFIISVAEMLADGFRNGNKLLVAGNGGSLCDAIHFAEELTGLFREVRPALPVIPLSDPGHLTCVANDLGFEQVFSRAIEAYGKPGDIFAGLTTSGKSPNMILAFERAKELGLKTVAFLGKGGGKLRGVADLELVIDGFTTSDRIQEAHMVAIHTLIECVEELLFKGSDEEIFGEMLSSAALR